MVKKGSGANPLDTMRKRQRMKELEKAKKERKFAREIQKEFKDSKEVTNKIRDLEREIRTDEADEKNVFEVKEKKKQLEVYRNLYRSMIVRESMEAGQKMPKPTTKHDSRSDDSDEDVSEDSGDSEDMPKHHEPMKPAAQEHAAFPMPPTMSAPRISIYTPGGSVPPPPPSAPPRPPTGMMYGMPQMWQFPRGYPRPTPGGMPGPMARGMPPLTSARPLPGMVRPPLVRPPVPYATSAPVAGAPGHYNPPRPQPRGIADPLAMESRKQSPAPAITPTDSTLQPAPRPKPAVEVQIDASQLIFLPSSVKRKNPSLSSKSVTQSIAEKSQFKVLQAKPSNHSAYDDFLSDMKDLGAI